MTRELAKKKKVVRIIEYQEDLQRSPRETLECILDEADKIDRIFIWHEIDGQAYYTPGSLKRDMTNSDIYWLLSKLMFHFMENV